jgi:hypothetical protein
MNTTVEIVLALFAVVAVYAACKRDWPTATAATTGILVLALLAIMKGDERDRDC